MLPSGLAAPLASVPTSRNSGPRRTGSAYRRGMSISTRWSVSREHEVTRADRDPNGVLTDTALARWVDDACMEYLAQCTVLAETAARSRCASRRSLSASHAPLPVAPAVVITASATQVLPRAFVIAVRLRTLGGDDDQVRNLTCEVTLVDSTGAAQALGDDVRDELIAIEHSARYFNELGVSARRRRPARGGGPGRRGALRASHR